MTLGYCQRAVAVYSGPAGLAGGALCGRRLVGPDLMGQRVGAHVRGSVRFFPLLSKWARHSSHCLYTGPHSLLSIQQPNESCWNWNQTMWLHCFTPSLGFSCPSEKRQTLHNGLKSLPWSDLCPHVTSPTSPITLHLPYSTWTTLISLLVQEHTKHTPSSNFFAFAVSSAWHSLSQFPYSTLPHLLQVSAEK